METVRVPAVAGMFYPAEENELRNEISMLLSGSETRAVPGNIRAIIAPHAGYLYSGRTAAYAYKMLEGKKFSTVVVISPSHREYFPGACIFEGSAYRTPLGDIPVNEALREKVLDGAKDIFSGTKGHRLEHALEVQLPFLQMLLEGFTVLPIVIGDQHKSFVYELADRLARSVDDKTLIVASSDMSHFHTKQKAYNLDSVVEERIKAFDYEGLLTDLELRRCEACGGGPIAAVMRTASLLGAKKSMIIDRSDSGDVTGDNSEVVGYLSAVLYE